MNEKRKLYLYEALELRGEYDGRIKTIKDCLPETRQNRDQFLLSRQEESRRRPSKDFDLDETRRQLRKLEVKRRRLNNAIQQANFKQLIEFSKETMNLNEALEARKGLNDQIGELHAQVVESAYQRVIYKEDRDIIEENELSYTETSKNLEEARIAFRELNRKLRKASFETTVDFEDE
jgi:hypothetical protein